MEVDRVGDGDVLRDTHARLEHKARAFGLREGAAHQLEGLDAAQFDCVVLNEVAQHFPDMDYLLKVLKKAAEAWLPHDVIYRRKRGLSVPIASWINHGLRSEVDRLLSPERLRGDGIVNENVVAQLLAEHRDGRANHAKPLWSLVMLQYWLETWA